MSTLDRIRVTWEGFVGAPGVSTFYANDATTLVGPLHGFFDALKTILPDGVIVRVPGSGDVIDALTGEMTNEWSTGAPEPVGGEATSVHSAVSGILVRWNTNTIIRGRRLKGHTFLVPVSGTVYDTSGQVNNTTVTAIAGAAGDVWSFEPGNMKIYQRPQKDPARAGGYAPVTSSGCSAVVTELRSRRD